MASILAYFRRLAQLAARTPPVTPTMMAMAIRYVAPSIN